MIINEHEQNTFKRFPLLRITGIVLSYVVTFSGIIFLLPWLFSLSTSWVVGFGLFVVIVPLFPAIQLILRGDRAASFITFIKIYVAEFALLFVQFLYFGVCIPFIIIAVLSRLLIALLIGSVVGWIICLLQFLGLKIGRRLAPDELVLFLFITFGLGIAVGIYFLLRRLVLKHEDSFYEFWARQFRALKKFFRY